MVFFHAGVDMFSEDFMQDRQNDWLVQRREDI